MISRHQSQKFGIWIQYLDISYLVISHDMGYDITKYRDISCNITPDHLETPQVNTNSTKTHHLVAVYFCFFGFVSALILACPRSGIFSSFFCCPSDGHIIGLTVSPANSNLVPSRLGLLPERMFVLLLFSIFFSFLFFSLFPCLFSFLIPRTWYSLVVARYLIYILL